MKRLFAILLAVVLVGVGCESDSKSSNNDLTPVLDAAGQAVTNDAGEPLFTDEDGNTGTEAELTAAANTSASDSEPATGQGGTYTGQGDTSDDSYGTDLGDSGNDNTGGDDSGGSGGDAPVGF